MTTKRTKGTTAQMKIRMAESLRAELEAAAERRGVSMNAEAVRRLGQSFGEEEAFGGAKMRNAIMYVATAFRHAGEIASGGKEDWLSDPVCYRRAVVGALSVLLFNMPKATDREIEREIHFLLGQLYTRKVEKQMAERER